MSETLRHTGQVRILKFKPGSPVGVAIHILNLDGGVPLAMVESSPPRTRDMLKEAYDKGLKYATCLETRAGVYTGWKFHASLSEAEEAERLAGKRIKKMKDRLGKVKKYFEEEWSMGEG
ncbi:MAG: hypothetical protein QW209_06430 [Nitrososphaerota archaeon]